ncbi:MAG: transglycosylase domain-containing protein [Solirubrobacteraceae bacterium]|nr:transglycosylase domain-containing protein [Solirubrobacteraceae bacterium]
MFVAAGLLFLSGISVLFGMMMAVAPQVKRLSADQEFQTAKNSTLYDRENHFLSELTSDEGRVILGSKGISPVMKQAVVAIEDQRFYSHKGVDLRGVARALANDLSGGPIQGASTIEQQFIKVVSKAQNDRTIPSKIRETALAYHLSHKWSKDKVLTEYLNAIYYGNGAYGIESAARTYFGRDPAYAGCGERKNPCASHLRPAHAAFLAGIINSPTANDPVENPVNAQTRRDIVLRKMRDQGMLNPVEYQDALAESIPSEDQIQPPKLRLSSPGSGYFVGWVRAQLVQDVGPRVALEGGLRVRTTLDAKLQKAAEESVGAWLSGSGPTASMVVIDNGTGEVRAMVGGANFEKHPFNIATQGRRQPGSSFKPFVLASALRAGISPSSTWESKKIEFTVNKKTGEKFQVNNYEGNYSGVTTLANATAFSDNSVYAQVGIKVGTKKVARLASDMGIRTPVSSNLAITLGAPKVGVTPLDLAHAYETFATGGKRISGTLGAPKRGPVGMLSIDTPDGSYEKENRKTAKRVLPEDIAQQTMGVLSGVVRIGSGKNAAIPGHVVWGKTGTTENYGDAWFVGSSEDLTVAVWVGYPDQTKPMLNEYQGEEVAGGTFPAQIFRTFMTRALTLEKAKRDALCAKKAKTKNPCKEDVKPTTPAVGTSPAAPSTTAPSTTPSAGDGPATQTGTGTGNSGSGGGTGAAPSAPQPERQTPATPPAATPPTPAPTPAPSDTGGVAPGT